MLLRVSQEYLQL